MEFYVRFWPVLGADLVRVLNLALSRDCLSRSQHRGVISLSFKKGDRLDHRNWYPITLLNVDYKIALHAVPISLFVVSLFLVSSLRFRVSCRMQMIPPSLSLVIRLFPGVKVCGLAPGMGA